MPRSLLINQDQFPYHVTTRTNNKEWFQLPLYEVWDFCKEAMEYTQQRCPATIHCFVLMSNHYHLLVTTPNSNIEIFMRYFNLKLSNLISKASNMINHRFSNRYKWTIINNNNYLLNTYRYIYQNPVRAHMTKDIISYPYSSIYFTSFEGKKFNYDPHILYKDHSCWLERRLNSETEDVITKCLKKNIFKPSKRISKSSSKTLNTSCISC